MTYIHQFTDWPNFTYQNQDIQSTLLRIKQKQGFLQGRLTMLGLEDQEDMQLEILSQDAVKTSAIEGEHLDFDLVRSSIARKLGIKRAGIIHPTYHDRRAEGIIEITLDATHNCTKPLTQERLFAWHGALFPTGRSGLYSIDVAQWRHNAMQVVSGTLGKEQVHFEAVAPEQVAAEMELFLTWFNTSQETDLLIQAAIAHLWFVTIHPFDDGNGRIARALTDLLLARAEGNSLRYYSLSTYIEKERNSYYNMLEHTQKGSLDITEWISWFLQCLDNAIEGTNSLLDAVIYKTKFWNYANQFPINPRQQKIINQLLNGFQGKLTTSKYAKLAKCSTDTALRDIQKLVTHGILTKGETTGRGTNYTLVQLV